MRRIAPLAVLSTVLVLPVLPAQAAPADATVLSVLGGGVVDGGAATKAALYATSAVYAPDGTLYIADRLHNRVRAVATDGTISTLAGTGDLLADGLGGFAGDGGPATSAALSSPSEVAVSPAGDVFVLDAGNHRVRRIDHATATITTVAGSGAVAAPVAAADATTQPMDPRDIAVDPATGDVAVADGPSARVWALHTDGSLSLLAGGGSTYPGDGGPPTSAQLSSPSALAYAADGALLIADYQGASVRRVSGGVISTVLGSGSSTADGAPAVDSRMFAVSSIAAAPDGTVYVGAPGGALRSFTVGGTISTVTGAPCSAATSVGPSGRVLLACTAVQAQQADGSWVAVAGARSQYDNTDSTPDGTTVAQAAVNPSGGLLNRADGLVVSGTHTVDLLGNDGLVHRIAGTDTSSPASPVGGQASQSALLRPTSVAAAPDGGLFLSDNGLIRLITSDGVLHSYSGTAPVYAAVTEGEPASALPRADALVSLPNGDLYAGAADRLVMIRWADRTVHLVGPQLTAMGGTVSPLTVIEQIRSVAQDSDGTLLVQSDEMQNGTFTGSRVRRLDPSTGAWSMLYVGQLLSAITVVDGTPYVAASRNHNALVQRLGDDGSVTTVAGGGHVTRATQTGADLFLTDVSGMGPAAGGGLLIASNEGRRVMRLLPGSEAASLPPTGSAAVSFAPPAYGSVTASLSWAAPVSPPSDAHLEYGIREGRDTSLVGRTGYALMPLGTSTTSLPGLTPGRRYTVSLYVVGATGDQSAPVTLSFVAPGDTTAPGTVQPSALWSRDSTASFAFRTPDDLDLDVAELRVVPGTTSPAPSVTPAWTGVGDTAVVSGLTVGQTYSASLTAVDLSGNRTQVGPMTFVAGAAPAVSLLAGPAQGAWTGSSTSFTPWQVGTGGTSPVCAVDGVEVACSFGSGLPLSLAAGSHVFTLHGTTPFGEGPTLTRTWNVDTTAPTAAVGALPAFTLAASAAVPLGGADAGSGIGSWNVRYQKAAATGAFGGWTALRATTSRATIALAAGYTYCVQAQSVDRAGLTSAWTASRCTTRPLDDRALAMSAGWTRPAASGMYLNTLTTTKTLRASLSKTVTYRQLALIATRCPTCGIVGVYSGATLVRSINLASATTIRQAVFALPVVTSRTGAISLRVLSSGKSVQVDGLGVARA